MHDHELMLIGLLLFPGVDLLDVGGPYEVFLTASRLRERQGAQAPFEVTTLSVDGKPTSAYGGLVLTPDHSAETIDGLDVLIVPGTIDVSVPLADSSLIEVITSLSSRTGTTTASVCTGAFLLAEAGLLQGRPFTTHWEDIDDLGRRVGSTGSRSNVRWVDDGDVVTSGGLSSGIAMALHLVDRFEGRELAEQTARQIDYDWQPEPAHPIPRPTNDPSESVRHEVLLGGPNEKRMGLARAVRVGNHISVGGTAAIAATGVNIDPADIEAQARRCYEIIGEALAAAGAGFDDVVRTRTMLVDIADYEVALEVRKAAIGSVRAAETIVQVVGFVDSDWRIEVEVDAVLT